MAVNDLIFETTLQIREYLPVPVTTEFDSYKWQFLDAQENFLVPVIGQAMLDRLIEVQADDTGASQQEKDLLLLARAPVACIGLAQSSPLMNLSFSQGGHTRNHNDKAVVASQWSVRDALDELIRSAERSMDRIYKYLDQHHAALPEYESSDVNAEQRTVLIHNVGLFAKYVTVQVGRFTLDKMRSSFERVQDEWISPVIGSALLNELIGYEVNREDWGVYAPLRSRVMRVIAHLGFAAALQDLSLIVDERGVYYPYNGRNQNMDETTAANTVRLRDMKREHSSVGENSLQKLVDHLGEHAGDYPQYSPPVVADAEKIEASEGGKILPLNGVS